MLGMKNRKDKSNRTVDHSYDQNQGSVESLGAVSLKSVAKALREGKRISIMFGRINLKKGDEEAAWIGDTLAKVCGPFHVDIAVGDEPRFNKIGLEICRRVRRIEKQGFPYGITVSVEELGNDSPYRGIDLRRKTLDEHALSIATASMESIIWNQNVWPVLVQLSNMQTMMGFLAGHHALMRDDEGRLLPVDAAVAFLNPNGSTGCGFIRSFKGAAVALGVKPRPKPDWLT